MNIALVTLDILCKIKTKECTSIFQNLFLENVHSALENNFSKR